MHDVKGFENDVLNYLNLSSIFEFALFNEALEYMIMTDYKAPINVPAFRDLVITSFAYF